MEVRVSHSISVYRGRVFQVRQDFIELPDGKIAQIDVVDHRGSVSILPLDDEGQIWFIRQYRQPIGTFLLELPAGVAEPGENPQENARRELREEIGMGAKKMDELGSFYLAPGYSNEFMHVFLAQELFPSPLPCDEDEILEVIKISASEAYLLAESGKIQDSKSIVALFWAKPYLLRLGLIKPDA